MMDSNMRHKDSIDMAVVGGGSWGTALAHLLAVKGHRVALWVYEREVFRQIEAGRENKTFLPGVTLPPELKAVSDIQEAVAGKPVVVIVVPSHVMRRVSASMAPFLAPDCIVVSASKGIENRTHLTMSGVLRETLPDVSPERLAVLSGPSFAKEVAAKAPTAVTVAARGRECARAVQRIFATDYFRVYTNEDVVGVELGGSIKNVIAIAAGMIDGLNLGLNTRAALITRGLTEIRRLGLKLGANPRTFTGLAGVGDLVLTCTGTLSRNHMVGKKLGEGSSLKEILAEMQMVAEGVKTAKSVYNLSRRLEVEMPICHAVYRILYEDLKPAQALYQLMTRDLRSELDEV